MQELPPLSGWPTYSSFVHYPSDPHKKEPRQHRHLRKKYYRYIRKPYLKKK
jgi:hypothetical protein